MEEKGGRRKDAHCTRYVEGEGQGEVKTENGHRLDKTTSAKNFKYVC